jgi:glycosyltransferase involved in cell wall biosynthesis
MKAKLCLITDTGWWDTDVTVLPYLKQYFDLEVHLIGAKDNNKFTAEGINKFIYQQGINVTIWERDKRIRNPKNLLKYLKLYRSIKRNNTKDAIIYYAYIYDPYINIVMLMVKKFKMLVSIHDYQDHVGLDNKLRRILKQSIIYKNNFFHFFSNNEVDKFKADHPTKKAFYTPMPLKYFGKSNITRKNEGPELKKSLLFFGFVRHYKGLDILIKALNKLTRNDYNLVIAGNADNWEDYNYLLTSNSNIIASRSFIADEDIPDYFAQAHYVVLPYRDATQSGPLLISLQYNVPVIASSIPCFENYIANGLDGFLYKPNDEAALIETLNNALDLDEQAYQNMKLQQQKRISDMKDKEALTGKCFSDFVNTHIIDN